jgi:hypothetical protein
MQPCLFNKLYISLEIAYVCRWVFELQIIESHQFSQRNEAFAYRFVLHHSIRAYCERFDDFVKDQMQRRRVNFIICDFFAKFDQKRRRLPLDTTPLYQMLLILFLFSPFYLYNIRTTLFLQLLPKHCLHRKPKPISSKNFLFTLRHLSISIADGKVDALRNLSIERNSAISTFPYL